MTRAQRWATTVRLGLLLAGVSLTGAASAGEVGETLTLELKAGGYSEAVGKRFSVETESRLSASGTRMSLRVRIRNRMESPIWRPLLLRLVSWGGVPAGVQWIESDNGRTGRGARWDYGQFLSMGGGLGAGEVSAYRDLFLESAPPSVSVGDGATKAETAPKSAPVAIPGAMTWVLRVTAVADPTFVPTALPQGALEGGTGGKKRWSGKILITYKQRSLPPESLAKINLAYGLAGQDFVEKLGIYIAHVVDGISLAQAKVLAQKLERHSWISGAEASVNDELVGASGSSAAPVKRPTLDP